MVGGCPVSPLPTEVLCLEGCVCVHTCTPAFIVCWCVCTRGLYIHA